MLTIKSYQKAIKNTLQSRKKIGTKNQKKLRALIRKKYIAGDLKMIDINKYLKAIHINWEQTFSNNENQSPNWTVLPKF